MNVPQVHLAMVVFILIVLVVINEGKILNHYGLRKYLDVVGQAVRGKEGADERWMSFFTDNARVCGMTPECNSFVLYIENFSVLQYHVII